MGEPSVGVTSLVRISQRASDGVGIKVVRGPNGQLSKWSGDRIGQVRLGKSKWSGDVNERWL